MVEKMLSECVCVYVCACVCVCACLSVCLSVQATTFELVNIETSTHPGQVFFVSSSLGQGHY